MGQYNTYMSKVYQEEI